MEHLACSVYVLVFACEYKMELYFLAFLVKSSPPLLPVTCSQCTRSYNSRHVTNYLLCVCAYVCVCVYIYICVCVYICVYIYMCVCVYIYVCVYMCIYIYVCVCVALDGRQRFVQSWSGSLPAQQDGLYDFMCDTVCVIPCVILHV